MIKLNGKIVNFKHFPNNEVYFNESELDISNLLYFLDFKFQDNSDLIELMFLKKYLDDQYPYAYIHLMIYYMPYSRMDRKISDYPFTLKYVSDFMNWLDFSKIYIIEAHSEATMDLIPESYSHSVLSDLINKANISQSDFVFYPDKGARDRYKSLNLLTNKILYANKERDLSNGKIIKYELVGDVKNNNGSKVFIIDDLCSAGGTFMHASKLLKDKGFNEIYLIVTHMEDQMFKNGQLLNNDLIKKIYTTNSILSDDMFAHDKVDVYKIF